MITSFCQLMCSANVRTCRLRVDAGWPAGARGAKVNTSLTLVSYVKQVAREVRVGWTHAVVGVTKDIFGYQT